MKKIVFVFCMILSFLFISCEDDKVEDKIDNAADKIENSIEKAEDKAEKALDKAEEKVDNLFD